MRPQNKYILYNGITKRFSNCIAETEDKAWTCKVPKANGFFSQTDRKDEIYRLKEKGWKVCECTINIKGKI